MQDDILRVLRQLITLIEDCDYIGHFYVDVNKEDVPIFMYTDLKNVKAWKPDAPLNIKIDASIGWKK